MQFEVDHRSPVPPSEQLADGVRFAVAAGRLVEGERLPSVRDVAKSTRLNPNTVSRAWRELEFGGFVASRRGSGVFIAEGAAGRGRAYRASIVAERLGRAVGDALAAGLASDEIIALTRDACAAWPLEPAPELQPEEAARSTRAPKQP